MVDSIKRIPGVGFTLPKPPKLPTQAHLAHVIDTIEDTHQQINKYHSNQLTINYEEMAEVHEATVKTIRKSAEKAHEKESWSYYNTVANAILSAASITVGLALVSSGVPSAMFSGAALCGAGASTLLTLYNQDPASDPVFSGGIALMASGLALIGERLGLLASAPSMPNLVMNIVAAGFCLVEAGITYQQKQLESDYEKLNAEKTKLSFQKRHLQFKEAEIHTAMKDRTEERIAQEEQVKETLKEEERCRSQILIEVRG